MQSVEDKILERLYRKGRGFCFSGVDFADLGSSASVDKALSSLAKQDKVRRLRRGLYDYPRFNEKLGGILAPDIHQAAMAIARKNGVKAQPSGALAANLLGLSTQVPAKMIYLTNGKTRTVEIGSQRIQFVHTAPKQMQQGHPLSCMVAHAFRWLGQSERDQAIRVLRRNLPEKQRRRLVKDLRYAENWLYDAACKVAQEDS